MLWILAVAAAADWKLSNPAIARYNEGVAAANKEAYGAAAADFAAAAKACGGCGEALLMQAQALFLDARPAEALALAEQIVAAWPTEPRALRLASQVFFVQQRFEDARRTAEAAVALDPADRAAVDLAATALIRMADYDAVERLINSGEALDEASKTCYRAQLAVERKDAPIASQLLMLCEQSSDTPLVAITRTRVGVLTGSHATVTDAAMMSGLDEIIDALALSELMTRGNCPEAIRVGKRRLAANASDVSAIEAVAYCQIETGDVDSGMRTLRMLFDAKEWIQVSHGGAITGIVTASGARAFNDMVAHGLGALARSLQKANRGADAEDVLDRAEARLGRTATVVASRGQLRMAQGDQAGAWEAVAAALALEPTSVQVLQLAGQVAFHDARGVPPEVARLLLSAGPPEARLNYATGLGNVGDGAACLSVLATIPDNPRAPAVGVQCASLARDRVAWNRWSRAAKAAQELPVTLVTAEAWQRCEEGHPQEALDLVFDVVGETPEDRRLLAQVRLRAWDDLGKLDEAVPLARTGEAPPEVTFNLGISLANANRFAEAREIMNIACPKLAPENRKMCEDTVKSIP